MHYIYQIRVMDTTGKSYLLAKTFNTQEDAKDYSFENINPREFLTCDNGEVVAFGANQIVSVTINRASVS